MDWRGRVAGVGAWMLVVGACGDSAPSDPDTGTTGTGTTGSTGSEGSTTGAADSTGDDSSTGTTTGGGIIEPAPLMAGVAMRVLDRPVGISMAGYGGRTGGLDSTWAGAFFASRGFYALPTIKAMVLEAGPERLVLLKTPLMSSESGITDALVAKMMDRHGVDLRGRIVTGGTHSHHIHARYWRLPDQLGEVGIDTVDEEVMDVLATEFADTIMEAIDGLAPAQWGYAAREDWDPGDLVYRDRRGENDFMYGKDPRLSVLAVQRPDGTPMAAVLNFGMHGTLLDSDNELLTEDAPGGLEMVFEEQFFASHGQPIFGMFMQAGGGDASPAGGQLGHDGIARAEVLGHAAAPEILALYEQLEWRDELALDVHSQRIELGWETFGYDEDPEAFSGTWVGTYREYTWGGWQCTNDAVPADDDPATSLEGLDKSCIPVELLLGGEVPHPEVHQTYLTTARLDELYLVTTPGEPTYSVMRYLRDEVSARDPSAAVMGIGYSQDHLLYFTHPDDWYQGGYESEMSLWGPYAGRTLIDTQVSVVDQMLEGQDMPPFVEQSPTLASPGGFTPRGYEVSNNAGALLQDVTMGMLRTEVVRFRFGGGDASLGAPRVRVQVDPGDGTFVDVPSPAGFPGAALDNSRYHMITHFEPIPQQSGEVLGSRAHEWYVDWELPAELPAATYRLVATGPWWDGAEQEYEVTSSPFAVGQHDGATLDVQRAGTELTMLLQLPATTVTTDGSWPVSGWRVLDLEGGAGQPITVRVPLALTFTVDGVPQAGRYTASYDAGAGGHVFDLADAGIDPMAGAVIVSAALAADVDPDAI
ncbi:MAG: hypothetical protein KDK70_26085, partial [Myxococcales bacterium]|nr:hypothetical protein [Myxococcales bacterium]